MGSYGGYTKASSQIAKLKKEKESEILKVSWRKG